MTKTNQNKHHFSDAYHRPYFMGVSIIAIFLYHIWSFTKSGDNIELNFISNFFLHGEFGVDIFFFLSTYGLSYSVNKNSLKQFYFNRFVRIAPVYVVFLIVCISAFLFADLKTALLYILSSLSGYASLKDCSYQVEWYTPSLILVYVLFPLVNQLSKRLAELNVFVLSLIIIILHTFLYYVNIGVCNMLAYRIPIIIFGCVYYYLEQKNVNSNIQVLAILALFGALMFAGNTYRVTLALPAVLYLAGMTDKLPFYSCISRLGEWSFEVYLAQVIATKYFIPHYQGSLISELIYVFLITICLSVIFSLVTHYSKIALQKIETAK